MCYTFTYDCLAHTNNLNGKLIFPSTFACSHWQNLFSFCFLFILLRSVWFLPFRSSVYSFPVSVSFSLSLFLALSFFTYIYHLSSFFTSTAHFQFHFSTTATTALSYKCATSKCTLKRSPSFISIIRIIRLCYFQIQMK